tara:strand:- start:1767 stop:2192 length:426 start_codon:yes stop_codon:yes gene_type:complete
LKSLTLAILLIISNAYALPVEGEFFGRYKEMKFEGESGECSVYIEHLNDGMIKVETNFKRRFGKDDLVLIDVPSQSIDESGVYSLTQKPKDPEVSFLCSQTNFCSSKEINKKIELFTENDVLIRVEMYVHPYDKNYVCWLD